MEIKVPYFQKFSLNIYFMPGTVLGATAVNKVTEMLCCSAYNLLSKSIKHEICQTDSKQ